MTIIRQNENRYLCDTSLAVTSDFFMVVLKLCSRAKYANYLFLAILKKTQYID
jgi:hypothetical protein